MNIRIEIADPETQDTWVQVDLDLGEGNLAYKMRRLSLPPREGYEIALVEWEAVCGPDPERGLKTGDVLLENRAVHYRRDADYVVERSEEETNGKHPAL